MDIASTLNIIVSLLALLAVIELVIGSYYLSKELVGINKYKKKGTNKGESSLKKAMVVFLTLSVSGFLFTLEVTFFIINVNVLHIYDAVILFCVNLLWMLVAAILSELINRGVKIDKRKIIKNPT